MAMATMPARPDDTWKLSWLRCTKAPMPLVDSSISEVMVTRRDVEIARRKPVTMPGNAAGKSISAILSRRLRRSERPTRSSMGGAWRTVSMVVIRMPGIIA